MMLFDKFAEPKPAKNTKLAKLRKGKAETIGRCFVHHCGHPTALWPWALIVDGELVTGPNGLAFAHKRDAVAAAHLIEDGTFTLFDRGLGPEYPRVVMEAGTIDPMELEAAYKRTKKTRRPERVLKAEVILRGWELINNWEKPR